MQNLINNMKKKSNFLILTLLLLFSLTLISAQPPFQTSNTAEKSIIIESPVVETHEANTNYILHAHPHNSSSGKIIPNSDIYFCFINIYEPKTGEHIVETNMSRSISDIEFEYLVLGGNFTEVGKQYAGYIYCEVNVSIEERGGFFEFGFDVTKTGTETKTAESLIYFILAFGVILLFILSFYFMIATPYSNETNEKGEVIKIVKLKYVKLALILLTWVLFTWFLNILIGLSDNFVILTMYYGFFGFMFDLMNNLSLYVGIVVLVIMGFEIVRDANIMDNIKKFGSSIT